MIKKWVKYGLFVASYFFSDHLMSPGDAKWTAPGSGNIPHALLVPRTGQQERSIFWGEKRHDLDTKSACFIFDQKLMLILTLR